MIDLYAKNERALRELHDEIVSDILTVLNEKGYTSGSVQYNDRFDILSDRLIINGYHTDQITADNLLKYLRDAYHVFPKID